MHFTATGDAAGAAACTVPAGFDHTVLAAMDRVGAVCGNIDIFPSPFLANFSALRDHTRTV